jgi:tetratricopeptide (TPR) repeat protein
MSSESEHRGSALGDSVRIGGYSLEIGTPAASFARFEPEQESENAQELAAALEEEPEEHRFAAIEKFEAGAQEVTGRIEEAEGLLRAAAEGQLLDPAKLTGEVDSLLGLLGRLDKSGRFEEELALMRSLNGLLALSLRWLELVRSLRSLLASAEAAGHKAALAWAHHELGSLHLCAGNAKRAARHLDEALRIEEQLGDLAGRCATRHNLDAARRELTGPPGATPQRKLLLPALLAALFVGLGAGGTSLAYGIRDGGGGGGTGDRSVAFTVDQDFEPDNLRASVNVTVSCTEGGTPDASPKPASENAPAVFAISDFGAGASCTATVRAPPAGYTTDASDCRNVSVTDSDSASCRVTSTRRTLGSVTFSVTKDFEPASGASVSVSVTCTRGGRPDASSKLAREGAPAVFTISGFRPGSTCTATEGTAPGGYSSSEAGCRDVAIARGRPTACTITNTRERPATVTFTVTKDFVPDDLEVSVSISVSCTEGATPAASPKAASENAPAVFTISGVGAGTTCTATEDAAPTGYTGNERDCLRVAIADKSSCTITNRLNSKIFSVGREFTDGNTTSLGISLTCDSGSVDPGRGTAADGSPVVFTVTGFTAGATCTATPFGAPSGYRRDDTACQTVPLEAGECTFVYTPVE